MKSGQGKSIANLRHANTSENLAGAADGVRRSNSNLAIPEHQMEDTSQEDPVSSAALQVEDNAPMNEQCNLGESTLQSTVHISHSNMIDQNMALVLSDFLSHPTAHLPRDQTTEIER